MHEDGTYPDGGDTGTIYGTIVVVSGNTCNFHCRSRDDRGLEGDEFIAGAEMIRVSREMKSA